MADGYHTGSEMGRREHHPLGTNPQETWLFTYNAQEKFMFIGRKEQAENLQAKVNTAETF